MEFPTKVALAQAAPVLPEGPGEDRSGQLYERYEDVARLSPVVRHPINMLGRYSLQLSDLFGGFNSLCELAHCGGSSLRRAGARGHNAWRCRVVIPVKCWRRCL